MKRVRATKNGCRPKKQDRELRFGETRKFPVVASIGIMFSSFQATAARQAAAIASAEATTEMESVDESQDRATGPSSSSAAAGVDHRSKFESELDQSQRSQLRKRKKKTAAGDGLGKEAGVKTRRKRLDPALQVSGCCNRRRFHSRIFPGPQCFPFFRSS